MNAQTTPHHEAKVLVQEILTGQHKRGPYGIGGLFPASDWAWAAKCAADHCDYAEIADMMADEETHERNPGVWSAAA